MSYKNPLHRFRGAELKEPILRARAIAARQVRVLLLANPQGMTQPEIAAKLPEGTKWLNYLRRSGFARVMPWNHKDNARKQELWFASEPEDVTS